MNVSFWHRSWMTAKTHQVSDAWNLQYLQFVAKREACEYITWKQRHLKTNRAIFPFPHGFVKRKKVLDTPISQLPGHSFLVICIGVNGIPARLTQTCGHVQKARVDCLVDIQ